MPCLGRRPPHAPCFDFRHGFRMLHLVTSELFYLDAAPWLILHSVALYLFRSGHLVATESKLCDADSRAACRLVCPKYNPARTFTYEGTVGLGGAYMCIYPMSSPGMSPSPSSSPPDCNLREPAWLTHPAHAV